MNEKHERKPRVVIPDLVELGRRLKKVDQHIVALLAKRTALAKQVQESKHHNALCGSAPPQLYDGSQPIIRLEVEEKRLALVRDWAEKRGVNASFASSILYQIIGESCKIQIDHLQSNRSEMDELEKMAKVSGEESYQILRQNLLALTAAIAPFYDDSYGKNADFATASSLEFENKKIAHEVGALKSLGKAGVALDLGCATGRIALMLAPHFERVIGYDISPQMIAEACKKLHKGNVIFKKIDLEAGIPMENESVSFVVMNLGTASDIRDLRRLVVATKRVLKKDGRFVFSFYNSGALLYHWFVPWPPSLTAEVNLDAHCLNVRIKDKIFRVYARPYSVSDVKKAFEENGLAIRSLKTYPTIAPILPSEFFNEDDPQRSEEMKKTAEEIDLKLADLNMGAYILITGRKT